jgi:hypothetical protein
MGAKTQNSGSVSMVFYFPGMGEYTSSEVLQPQSLDSGSQCPRWRLFIILKYGDVV